MPRRRGVFVVLGLLILVLAGIAGWLAVDAGSVTRDADRHRAEAAEVAGKVRALTEGVDTANAALTDTAKTAEVLGAVRPVVEQVLSYDYRDLDRTAKAVADNLDGSARCVHDQLFAQVKQLASAQQLVVVSRVREIGVTRLEGEQAVLLAFVDQSSTRAGGGPTNTSGAQLGFHTERKNGRWMITRIDVLGQPLSNGQQSPQC